MAADVFDFNARLQRAIARGERIRDERAQAAQQRELTDEELRQLHARYRIDLADRISDCLKKLADHLPGFEYSTVMGEDGWGGRIRREELQLKPGKPAASVISRLEMLVSPHRPGGTVLEMTVKGTVRNREVINRRNFHRLTEVDLPLFLELVEQRALEYAELYAAQ